jgi:hypothetical protein
MVLPTYKWFPALVAALLAFGAYNEARADQQTVPEQTQCIICHTNVKGLIRLSWEIEKLRPKKAESAETSGEG